MFGNLRKRFENHRKVSQTVRELSQLNDRELNDLGISRCDIHRVSRAAV